MLRIEITSTQSHAETRNVTSSDGKEYVFRQQNAYAFLGGDYPELFTIQLEKEQPPYPAGFYTLDVSSFKVGKYSRLSVANVRLIPSKS